MKTPNQCGRNLAEYKANLGGNIPYPYADFLPMNFPIIFFSEKINLR